MSRDITTVAVVGLGQTGAGLAAAAQQAGLQVLPVGEHESLDGIAGADLVIEAVPEAFEAKVAVLAVIDKVAGEGSVIATTATAIPVADLALTTSDPGRVIGVHPAVPP